MLNGFSKQIFTVNTIIRYLNSHNKKIHRTEINFYVIHVLIHITSLSNFVFDEL